MDSSITFKVCDVDGAQQQNLLENIFLHAKPFDEGVKITFRRYEQSGHLAIGIYANAQQIGTVPANLTEQVNLLWAGKYRADISISEESDKYICEITASFEQPAAPKSEVRYTPEQEYMRCPICGRRLRRSKKNPEYGLCDACAKKFKWVDEDDYELADFNAPTESRHKPTRNACAIVSLILTLAYLVYSIFYWNQLANSGASSAVQFGNQVAIALVFPHLIAVVIGFLLNAIGVILPNRWFILSNAIVYIVAMILFVPYSMFVIVQTILSFISFGLMSRKNAVQKGISFGGKISIALISVLVIAIGYIAITEEYKTNDNNGSENTITANNNEEIEIMEIDPDTLLTDYEANEVRGDELYDEKMMRMSGTVGSIGKDLTESVYITFQAADEFSFTSVQCFFEDEAEIQKVMNLSEGDQITIVGTCTGKFGNVFISDCKIE